VCSSDLFKSWIDVSSVDTAFICGPGPMMEVAETALKKYGLADQQIKIERFSGRQPGKAKLQAKNRTGIDANKQHQVTIKLDGTLHELSINGGEISVLNAALEANLDVPYACKAGVCASCRAKVVEGKVEMDNNFALEDYEVRDGYVLTCQSHPLTDKVVIDYDQ